ncbi:MAG TPA: trehalose-phosphatase [Burkholderiales bacterium]|nr:trehalose-phosphatase [Burkholderiales bacterium]
MTGRRMPPFSERWAFFLDVDGTLLEYAQSPQGVHVREDLLELLRRLQQRAAAAVALISGRSVADIDRLFAPLVFPVAGQHGTERRKADGSIRRHAPAVDALGRAAAELVRLTAAHSGLVLENKGITLALHYRLAPSLRPLAEREMRALAATLGDAFELQTGKFVVEVKPSGKDKGHAIADFMEEPPFRGRQPVFLGDDLTDEAGFEAVNRLGGHSIKVGPGITRARWRLFDASAVRRWLGEYLARSGASEGSVRTGGR